eukprot:CAMPEP_0184705722 /NCGR_PEP_ID=MMETSP0313-20130426/35277_1 /TAXON_ID=2792 /ORGANISM="Porphyridium aerugineum, Strain SAG 1380-2" /LENGTH=40 /DNA_ID= /DNA_START= /DNA_END= /DNA_ORIENTATION=
MVVSGSKGSYWKNAYKAITSKLRAHSVISKQGNDGATVHA